jgi:hypothetical protein
MEENEARVINNQYVSYMILTIILSGVFFVIWIFDLNLRFIQSPEWFLEGWIIFLALSIFWYYRIKKVKELIGRK